MPCEHNFLGESPCAHCGVYESDYIKARIAALEGMVRELALRLAPILNMLMEGMVPNTLLLVGFRDTLRSLWQQHLALHTIDHPKIR